MARNLKKIVQDKIILAWCYFKEESFNLGIIKIME